MKDLSRAILFISALLVLLLAIPRKVHTLKVDIINTEASYYVDVLADKNKVDGEMPEYYSRIKETDEDTFNDLCILKNYEFNGKVPLQMNGYTKGLHIPGSYYCENNGSCCILKSSSNMPAVVQLVLMGDNYQFFVSDPIYFTYNNNVIIDFNTMQVVNNRNLTIVSFLLLPIILTVIDFWLRFRRQKIKYDPYDIKPDKIVKLQDVFFNLCYLILIAFLIGNRLLPQYQNILAALCLSIALTIQSNTKKSYQLIFSVIFFIYILFGYFLLR